MYLQLAKCVFNQQFQYRESVFFQLVGNFLWIYIQICIWWALLGVESGNPGEIGFRDMVAYTTMSFLLGILTQSNIASELSEKVKTGMIAIDLIRPISLKWYLFWQQLSANLFQCLFIAVPIMISAFVLWPYSIPIGINLLMAFVSSILAVILIFYFQYTVGLLVFWFKDGTYASMLINGLMELFSGRKIPLWFYPAVLASICEYLPFQFMVYEPIAILLNYYERSEMISIVALQIVWILFFMVLEKIIWKRLQTHIEVQGG